MAMPRLFSAVEIPRSIAERLIMFRSGLSGARWIDPENYHMTLRFIGDVDGATARDFMHALGKIEMPPFELRLSGLDSFGGKKPRTLFADLAPSRELEMLQHATERAAREAGLPPEGRNFKPHVTLARLRGARASTVATYLQHNCGLLTEPFTVSRFVLYSSRDSVGGGPYVVEAAYDLEDGLGAEHALHPEDAQSLEDEYEFGEVFGDAFGT
jgi:2'-5' RNA ligase